MMNCVPLLSLNQEKKQKKTDSNNHFSWNNQLEQQNLIGLSEMLFKVLRSEEKNNHPVTAEAELASFLFWFVCLFVFLKISSDWS